MKGQASLAVLMDAVGDNWSFSPCSNKVVLSDVVGRRASLPQSALNVGKAFLDVGKAFIVIVALAISSGAYAQSSSDGHLLGAKPSLLWLSDDVNVAVMDGLEYDSFLGSGELWNDQWGVSAKLLENRDDDVFGLPTDSEYFNFDVKRRFGSKDRSNFELGLGWQEFNINEQLQASGPKVSLSGRYSFTSTIQLYGETAYFPELEEQISDLSTSGFEVEAGVLYQPIPSVSLKAGYRKFSISLDDPIVEDLSSSSGFLLGTDLSF